MKYEIKDSKVRVTFDAKEGVDLDRVYRLLDEIGIEVKIRNIIELSDGEYYWEVML